MQTPQQDYPGPANRNLAIFVISVLGLFLEMLLIRWIGTEVRIFAYLQNTVLVVCFLGLGLGCFTSRHPIVFRQTLINIAVVVLLLVIPITRGALGTISELLSALGDLMIWNYLNTTDSLKTVLYVALGLGLTYGLMVLILDIFVPIGRLLGRLMDDHPNTIWAYSINVGGSLVGTWLFVLLSLLYQPPSTWFAVLGLLSLFFLGRAGRERAAILGLAAGIAVISSFSAWVPGALEVVWSPYQKLVLAEGGRESQELRDYVITVNNVGYQSMTDLTESRTISDPERFPPWLNGLTQYDIPLLLHPKPQAYLVVGAGAGNDAAGGLRHGVSEITAVEIDPAIISMGRRYHPERPYGSPSVEIVNDDARSFFSTTAKRFDVIAFGLLDSHTSTAMTNARLDHYVYTRESIERARSLLAEGGIVVLSFEAQKPYIADRMARVLRDVFGEEPISFRMPHTGYGWGGVMFVAGDLEAARGQMAGNPRLEGLIETLRERYPVPLSYTTKVATDDWPYIYLQDPSIPTLYYLLAALMLVILVRSYWQWRVSGLVARWSRSHWHFFFLGAAFLLLEVQNISKASVVLGNTWQVNAVIVSGVLAMILLANLLAHRFPRMPLGVVYSALIGICLALYLVDLAQFSFLPYATKAVIVGGLTALPMLFSGIIFIRSFAEVVGKDEALGANLIGSLVGAMLQSLTFVIGIKALLLVVAGLYCLSLLTRPAPRGRLSEALGEAPLA